MIESRLNSEEYNKPYNPAHIVFTASGEPEEGDEPAQLHRIADTVKDRLQRAQEEIVQAT
jgi:hypothetical protein